MKSRFLLTAAALLSLAASALSQPTSVTFVSIVHQLRAAGVESCESGAPLPDGTIVHIRQDVDGNGPSANDPLPVVGDQIGQVNFNSFVLNGEALGFGPGYFYTDPAFTSVGYLIEPNNWYLTIDCPNNPDAWHYTSPVFHFEVGPQEIFVNDWICQPCLCCDPCDSLYVIPDGYFEPNSACLWVCEGVPLRILARNDSCRPGPPPVSIVPGCNPEWSTCDSSCTPTEFIYDPGWDAWTFDSITGLWSNTVEVYASGCICVTREYFLGGPWVYYMDPADPLPQVFCVNDYYSAICIGPVTGPEQYPVFTVLPGCGTCPGLEEYTTSVHYDPVFHTYLVDVDFAILEDVHCFTVTFDAFLAVDFNDDFLATPLDGMIELSWSTASETDNDRFDIERNGSVIAHVPSQGNGATEHRYTWTDRGVTGGTTYNYSLVAVDINGGRATLATLNATPVASVITEYALSANYPNPFNPRTSFSYSLKDAGWVTLNVYDLSGRLVSELAKGNQAVGKYTVTFDGSQLPSGIYFYRLNVNGFTASNKMMLLK